MNVFFELLQSLQKQKPNSSRLSVEETAKKVLAELGEETTSHILSALDKALQTRKKNISLAFPEENSTEMQLGGEKTTEEEQHTRQRANLNGVDSIISQQVFKKEDRYKVIKTLGEGGMGIVQLVQDRLLRREVALKKIKKSGMGTGNLSLKQRIRLWRLHREAEFTAILEHPNIIPLYDMDQSDQLTFTMRKVEGKTFRGIIEEERKKENSNPELLLSIFLKACDAVAYAHNQGIVHRDLKTDNVMVGSFGEVYVMDWGIARKLKQEKNSALEIPFRESELFLQEDEIKTMENMEQHHFGSGDVFHTIGGIGTEGYMAPEQRQDGRQAIPASDIYSLGKILRECYTGLTPMQEILQAFKDGNLHSNPSKNKQAKTINKSFWKKNLPVDIAAIIEKATQEEVSKRYHSVQEFIADVERFKQHRWISARDFTFFDFLESISKWIKRNKQRFFLMVIVLLLSVAFPLYFKWKINYQQELEFQENWKKAIKEKKFRGTFKFQEAKVQGEMLKQLLGAFNNVNKALAMKQNHLGAEQTKFSIGLSLVYLCCVTEDYHFASYVAEEIQNLKSIPIERKREILTFVGKEKNKLLKQHKQRFQYWKNRFLTEKQGFREWDNALVELSKMQEEEIFKEFLQILEESTLYFSTLDKQNTSKKSEYYNLITAVLGQLKNPKAKKPLLLKLEKFADQMGKLPPKERSFELINHMVFLIRALVNLEAIELEERIRVVRYTMGPSSNFWKKSEDVYRKLLSMVRLGNSVLDSFSDYYRRGVAKGETGDYVGAIEDLTQAINLKPDKEGIYNRRGAMKSEIGDSIGAIEDFNRAIALKKDFSGAYSNRGLEKENLKDFQGAMLDYSKAIKFDPLNIGALNNQANLKRELGDYDGSILDFNKILELNPEHFIVYRNRGLAKFKKTDYEGALADFTKGIRLNSEDEMNYIYRAFVLNGFKKYEQAIQDCNKALRLNPKNEMIYNHRGLAKQNKGDIIGAIQDFTHAISLKSDYLNAYQNRGLAKFEKMDFDGAIEDYNQIINKNPSFKNVHFNRGIAKEAKGDFEGAIEDFTEAIRLEPRDEGAYTNRGNVKQHRGDFEGAIKDFTQVIKVSQNPLKAYVNRGICKSRTGDFKGAIEDYNAALNLDSSVAKAFAHRGDAKRNNGDLVAALKDFDQALFLEPGSIHALVNRGSTRLEMNKLVEAKADFEKALQIKPNNPVALMNLGMIFHELKEYEKAKQAYKKGLDLQYDLRISQMFLELLLKEGMYQYRKKEFKALKITLSDFLKYAPKDHPKLAQVKKMLLQIENQLKKKEK